MDEQGVGDLLYLKSNLLSKTLTSLWWSGLSFLALDPGIRKPVPTRILSVECSSVHTANQISASLRRVKNVLDASAHRLLPKVFNANDIQVG